MTREDMRNILDGYNEAHQALKRLQARRKRLFDDLNAADDIKEIGETITKQSNICSDKMKRVMKLIGIFPVASRKNEILTMKYIDGLSWYKISSAMYLSESACRKVEQMAVDELIAAASEDSGGALSLNIEELFE